MEFKKNYIQIHSYAVYILNAIKYIHKYDWIKC